MDLLNIQGTKKNYRQASYSNLTTNYVIFLGFSMKTIEN
jgi:hypothetical protein